MKKTYLSYSFILLSLLSFTTALGQGNYFPGGLGNTNLKAWVNANNAASVSYNGSNQVSQWSDLSGNAYNFVQATTANQPIYNATAGPNNLPGIVFTRANSQYLSTAQLPSSISFAGGVSTLSVLKFTSSGNYERLYDFGNGNESDNIIAGRIATQANFFYEGWNAAVGGQVYTTTTPIVNGTANMYEAIQQGGTAGNNTAVAFYSAGTAQSASGALGSSISPLPKAIARSSNYIARSSWTADAYYEGSISELLFYNTALNGTQRSILENYLSAAWGMAVSPSYYTPPTATTFNKNLVAIGYTGVSDNILANPAGSTDGLGFSSGTGAGDFLNSAGFIMAAHNGQANTLLTNITITGITPTGINQLNRSWFMHRTGANSTGAVTGTNLLITQNYTTSGSKVNFAVTASSLADGYYSLVWSTTSVLPVKLLRFSAQQGGPAVTVSWETAEQFNLGYFDIERSADGSSFSSIGTVTSTGNTAAIISYQFTDKQPAAGLNYYRLRMVDLDGSTTYSTVRLIAFAGNRNNTGFAIYPNPATGVITINCGAFTGMASLQIVNAIGQPVYTASKNLTGVVALPVGFLAKGVYYLQINSAATSFTNRFIRE